MFLAALRHNLHKRHAHQGGGAEGASVCSSSRLDMKRMRRKTVPGAAPSTTSSSTKMSPLSFDSRRWITRPCSCCVSSVGRVGVERRAMDRERRLLFWGGEVDQNRTFLSSHHRRKLLLRMALQGCVSRTAPSGAEELGRTGKKLTIKLPEALKQRKGRRIPVSL